MSGEAQSRVDGAGARVEHLRRINGLLAEALALPEAGRVRWLARLAEQDPELARELGPLLQRVQDGTDRFMSGRASQLLPDALNEQGASADRAGDRVGPYRLIREIGRGGMGAVWLAERADGAMQRQVALKLPLHGWAPGVRERLVQERDRLAALEHPHIARLYDAGTTPDGRPYLAMEFVDGVPIDVFASQRAASVEERLRLFLQVAQAVSYAHGRLVVHRDLKPSNIFVTHSGEVRLLDFGAAKLIDDEGVTATGLTQWAGRVLSPDYASPEQILGEPITVASDVYSAGVVLYELLTGTRPYRLKRESRAQLEEAILAADVPLASASATDPAVAHQLRGDLDAILAKALQRSAPHRYSSMEALGEDLARHLSDEPVHAKPPSRRYRFGKFVRRNLGAVLAAAAVTAALVVGGGAALWQARAARIEAQRAAQVQAFIASIFTQAVPKTGEGGVVTAIDLLDAAARRIETELADQPAVAAELGVIIAQSFDTLGAPEKAEAPLRAAISRAERALGPTHRVTVHGKLRLAIAIGISDPVQSEAILAEVIPQAMAGLPDTAVDAGDALEQQSFVVAKQERAEEAYAYLQQSIALREHYLGRLAEDTIWGLGLLSNTYGRFGQRERQLATATEALRRAREALGRRRPHNTLISIERWYADALRANERPRESVPILRQVLRDQQQLDAAPTVRVRNAQLQLARSLIAVGWVDQALPLVREAVALEQQQNPQATEDRQACLDTLVSALVAARRSDEAATESQKARAVGRSLTVASERTDVREQLQDAAILGLMGRYEQSRAVAQDVIGRATGRWADVAGRARVLQAAAWRMQGRPEEALGVTRALTAEAGYAELPLAIQAAAQAESANAQLDLGKVHDALSSAEACYRLNMRAQVELSVQSADCVIANARLRILEHRGEQAEALLLPLLRQWETLGADARWRDETRRWLDEAAKTGDCGRSGQRNCVTRTT